MGEVSEYIPGSSAYKMRKAIEEDQVLHRVKIGRGEYKVKSEDEKIIEGWEEDIKKILEILERSEFSREALNGVVRSEREAKELAKTGSYNNDLSWVFEKIESGMLSEEDKKLLAIGLWLIRDKGIFRFSSFFRTLLGRSYDVKNVTKKHGLPNCIDTTVVVKEMAAKFGVPGDVVARQNNPMQHRYFRSDNGRVLDVWEGKDRGGWFEDEDDLEKNGHKMGVKHIEQETKE